LEREAAWLSSLDSIGDGRVRGRGKPTRTKRGTGKKGAPERRKPEWKKEQSIARKEATLQETQSSARQERTPELQVGAKGAERRSIQREGGDSLQRRKEAEKKNGPNVPRNGQGGESLRKTAQRKADRGTRGQERATVKRARAVCNRAGW